MCKSSGVSDSAPGGEIEKGPVTRTEGGDDSFQQMACRMSQIIFFLVFLYELGDI